MKYVVVHASGLLDIAQQSPGTRTLLQTASTPVLDGLARNGVNGSVMITLEGAAVHSDLVQFAILGYDPQKHYPGPAPFEAAGQGVVLGDMDVAYVCSMVTLRSGGRDDVKKLGPQIVMEDTTAGGIDTAQARELIDAVNEQVGSETIQFYPGNGHRHVMVWVGGKSRAICVPPKDVMGLPIGSSLPHGDGGDVLRQLMEASLVILRDHPVNEERRGAGLKPANCLWLWGQGRWPKLPSLLDRYQINGAIVSEDDLHRGVGICAGLEPSGTLTANVPCSEHVLRELEKKDFVYLHVELPVEVTEAGDPGAKIKFIEEFDRHTVGPIMEGLQKLGPHRVLAVCDSAWAESASGAGTAMALYALSQGLELDGKQSAGKFSDGQASSSPGPSRDATKLLARLLAQRVSA
jgi:2,3-bisphosphoglycerate-independent phosphoglycerate mutase